MGVGWRAVSTGLVLFQGLADALADTLDGVDLDCVGVFKAIDRGVVEWHSGFGGLLLDGDRRDIPDMAEELFDGLVGRQFYTLEVSGFYLDENAAVGAGIDATGLEVSAAQSAVVLVVGRESGGGSGGGLEDRNFLGGVDENEKVAMPAPTYAGLARVTIWGFAWHGAVIDEVRVTSDQVVAYDMGK